MPKMKNLLASFTVAAATILGGCTPYIQISNDGTQDTDFPKTELTYSQVFNGAANQPVCKISGNDLQKGNKYSFYGGLLIINGDVPADTKISVYNGKVYINGDIGEGAVIDGNVPEKPNEFVNPGIDRGVKRDLSGRSEDYVQRPIMRSKMGLSNSDIFKYHRDSDPAVVITGAVGPNAKIRSNHGIHIAKSVDSTAKLKTWYDTRITHGKVPNLFITPSIKPTPSP